MAFGDPFGDDDAFFDEPLSPNPFREKERNNLEEDDNPFDDNDDSDMNGAFSFVGNDGAVCGLTKGGKHCV